MDATITLSGIGSLYTVLIIGLFYPFGMPTEFALSANPSDCKHKDARERAIFRKFDFGKRFEKLPIFIVSVTIYLTETSRENLRAFYVLICRVNGPNRHSVWKIF
jgi:hypothetical protein